MGIDWTTTRLDSQGRKFDYVPLAQEDLYGPVHELWPEVSAPVLAG